MNIIRFLIIIIAVISFSGNIFAFRDHALLAYYVFSDARNCEEFSTLNNSVSVQSMEKFLEAVSQDPKQYEELKSCFEEIEKFSKEKIPGYQPVPDSLKLTGNKNSLTKSRFLDALRINSAVIVDPCVRSFLLKVDAISDFGKEFSAASQQTALGDIGIGYDDKVKSLTNNEPISAFAVLCTACDEPDYGYDQLLFQKSPTDSDEYDFGIQPFAATNNPSSTQAPFHMGFFHEAWILNKLAPSFMQSYVEYRVKQYTELSKFAFKNGHDYWGWRFLGWSLHYVQDLCQPYHSTLMPGTSTVKLVFAGLLSTLGMSYLQDRYTNLASNLHCGFELYVYGLLNFGLNPCLLSDKEKTDNSKTLSLTLKPSKCSCRGHQNPNSNDIVVTGDECKIREVLEKLIPTLKNPEKCVMPKIALEDYPRKEISLNSKLLANDLASVLQEPVLPKDFYLTSGTKSWDELNKDPLNINNFNNDNCNKVVKKIFGNIATYSRFFAKSIRGSAAEPKKISEILATELLAK